MHSGVTCLFGTKNQIGQTKKSGQKDYYYCNKLRLSANKKGPNERTAKIGPQLNIIQCQNLMPEPQKSVTTHQKLVHRAVIITFAFTSKLTMKKSTCCEKQKKHENQF